MGRRSSAREDLKWHIRQYLKRIIGTMPLLEDTFSHLKPERDGWEYILVFQRA